jgi:flagellum-specific peptidoglycan hydrolase FlgJ
MTREQYIEKITPLVQRVTKDTGLFPSVMIAQAILESSDSNGNVGGSILASKYNNHFGIKAGSNWKGKTVNFKTGEYTPSGQAYSIVDAFRAYDTIEEGFKDRIKFLQQNPRYAKTGVFTAKTPEEQSAALKKAGYATAPEYASTLNNLLKKYSLATYDYIKKNKYQVGIGVVLLGTAIFLTYKYKLLKFK